MADEIKQKIVLEGEKEYSAALKEANRNLKTLRSELKAETAELGANASAQQKNETKIRSLRKQIEQQEKVVSTLKTALKEVKDRYGDNSEEVAKWEQKLNQARFSLATMQNQLSTTEAELQKTTDAYGEAADAVSDYADAAGAAEQTANEITLQGAISAADNLTSKMKSAFNVIKEVTTAAWDWMKDSGQWADELTTNATKWGVDRQTLQGWSYAARFVDTEVETIARAFTKLNNRSDSTNKKLKEIGIMADAGVKAQDVFWEVVEALEGMDEATRDATAQDIFGKSYQELLPLIQAGRAEWEKYIKEAEEAGYILDEDQLNNLTAFDDAWQRMDASVQVLKRTVASELAPAFKTIADSLGEMVTKFTEWSQTEQGKETLKGLGDALSEIVTSLTSETNFQGLVDGAAEAIRGLTGALGWINDHKELVVGSIGAIGAAFAGLTIAKDVMNALLLIKGINWAGIGGKAAAKGVTDTATGGAAAATSAGAKLSAAGIAKAIGGTTAFITTLFGDLFREADSDRDVIIDEATGALTEDAKKNGFTINDVGEVVIQGADSWDVSDAKSPVPEEIIEDIVEDVMLSDVTRGEAEWSIQDWWDAYKEAQSNPSEETVEEEQWMLDVMAENLGDVFGDVWDSLQTNLEESKSPELMDDIPVNWYSDILDAVTWQDSDNQGLSSEDLTGFRSLPSEIKKSAQAGVAAGMSGINVSMDGYAVGRVVAPYVSQMIGSQMMVNT